MANHSWTRIDPSASWCQACGTLCTQDTQGNTQYLCVGDDGHIDECPVCKNIAGKDKGATLKSLFASAPKDGDAYAAIFEFDDIGELDYWGISMYNVYALLYDADHDKHRLFCIDTGAFIGVDREMLDFTVVPLVNLGVRTESL